VARPDRPRTSRPAKLLIVLISAWCSTPSSVASLSLRAGSVPALSAATMAVSTRSCAAVAASSAMVGGSVGGHSTLL